MWSALLTIAIELNFSLLLNIFKSICGDKVYTKEFDFVSCESKTNLTENDNKKNENQ